MTIRELIEHLEGVADEHGDETQVRIASQPNWPLEYRVDAVGATRDGVCYIAEGTQVGYLSGAAAYAVGWRDEDPDEDDPCDPGERVLGGDPACPTK